jgi:hypothetical protein
MDTTKPLQNHINFVNKLAERFASIGFPVNEKDILLSLLTSLSSVTIPVTHLWFRLKLVEIKVKGSW